MLFRSTTQAAYVFMYVACHADILHQVLVKGQTVGAFDCLAKDEIQVTSLGGGPGSDLLALVGLIRSLRPDERPKRIKYRVLDKQPNWHEILKAVAVGQRGTVDIDVSFQQVDVTVPDEWKNITCVNDNLLIMNFFVSEVCVLREAQSVRQCLENLLGTVSGGATVVFNDSKFPSCYDYFDARVAAANGFARLVVESSRLDATTDFDEFFRECMVRFDRTPKLGSNAAYRVLKKQ